MNTIFTKRIHKIMFDIHNQPFFEWPRPMGGNPIARNSKLRCSYHKAHCHRTENCKTLKQFLEGLVSKGYLAEYIKSIEKACKKDSRDNNDDESPKRPANKVVTEFIKAIHTSISLDAITNNAIKV